MSASPQAAKAADRTGMFAGLNGKKVSGSAQVGGSGVTLSGFSSDEGPDLHVYLTDGTDEAAVSAGKEIGAVKFDKASQIFTLSGADASAYSTVVIHCDKAKAVFGAAKLS
ncbi:DM13 domain-containing protein [Streptomyces sp. NPDC051576]|uniref:DM13 domain-containing protein n=1 Tax=Streptomyces sp. NPDC051576 TaxID=3155803 RepID=UPI0034499FC7